jgi:hypothetical protein
MATNALIETFLTAIELFNAQRWADLEPLLHNDVTMKRIDDPIDYHAGKSAVMGYFFTNGKADKATVKPTSQNYQIVGNLGLVWGSADWIGTSGAAPVQIAYAYVFKRVNDQWLALNLWGGFSN